MEEASVTTVQIFGREYKIRGHADKNYIAEMAKYVDNKMKELASNSSLPSQDRLAILVALNIADELFQERAKTSETISAVEQRANRLIALLDESLLAEK
ncbi:MAG: cell division protein ZapA [Candidatus Krumholzibacteria bacterium]|nr:cell division protein ZapA [Candidatus Krumholzibacteria bacterium]